MENQGKAITTRAIEWNKARYEQKFDFTLARDLLLEETDELFRAKTTVDVLDASGDIIFVAIGVLWKLGFSDSQIYEMLYSRNLSELHMDQAHVWMCTCIAIGSQIHEFEQDGAWPAFELALYSIFIVALGGLRGVNMQKATYDIVHAICDSNDTKEIVKTDPSIKANVNKGEGYIPPTDALIKLVNYVNLKVN